MRDEGLLLGCVTGSFVTLLPLDNRFLRGRLRCLLTSRRPFLDQPPSGAWALIRDGAAHGGRRSSGKLLLLQPIAEKRVIAERLAALKLVPILVRRARVVLRQLVERSLDRFHAGHIREEPERRVRSIPERSERAGHTDHHQRWAAHLDRVDGHQRLTRSVSGFHSSRPWVTFTKR